MGDLLHHVIVQKFFHEVRSSVLSRILELDLAPVISVRNCSGEFKSILLCYASSDYSIFLSRIVGIVLFLALHHHLFLG